MPNRIIKPNSISDYIGAVFVMVAFFVGVVGFWFISSRSNLSTPSPSNRPPLVSCPPDFLSYQTLNVDSTHVVKLISIKKSMFAANKEFINSEVVITKNETKTSKVACGYLFIRAGTSRGALQSWEDVVVNPNGFGGHLLPSSAISINDGAEYSEYLYGLNKIQYWPTHDRESVNNADWSALLNVSDIVPFIIALNTENQTGFIDEISIAYKCWDPSTGEESVGCSLTVTSSIDSPGIFE